MELVNNIYSGISTTPAVDGTDNFNGMLEIRGLQVSNITSSDKTVNIYLTGYPGDGVYSTQSYFMLFTGTIAGNTQKQFNLCDFSNANLAFRKSFILK